MYDVVKLVVKFLTHRRLRTILTTFGIAIGVTLVFSITSLKEGTMAALTSTVDQLGTDIVTITTKMTAISGASELFSQSDINAIENLYFVEFVGSFYSSVIPVIIRGEEEYLTVSGINPDAADEIFKELPSFKIESGRMLNRNELGRVLIGHTTADEYNLQPGSQIEIKGKKFRVVGVLGEIGVPMRDNSINMIVEELWELLGIETEQYQSLMVKVNEMKLEEIEKVLKRARDGKENFEVSTPQDMIEQAGQILDVMSIVFSTIAGISVIIGAINVANTMYMAVTERTRDIGVMKAVGAKERDILMIFLIESGFLSLIGGLVGAIFGYGLATAFAMAARQLTGISNLAPIFSPSLVFGTAILSFVIGVISGILPARKASKLQPLEALHYE